MDTEDLKYALRDCINSALASVTDGYEGRRDAAEALTEALEKFIDAKIKERHKTI